ncbi:MAG: (d)CMP kinase, partial [Candidatus Omnitrophica bacterium]|nr:(d)CMP kinase [Candidatus Omnitrophota bacterium]
KYYLDAKPEVRANRRHKDLVELGHSPDVEDVKKDIMSRDKSDMTRDVGALKKADDAFFIDTTDLSIDEVVEKILTYVDKVS